MRQVSIGHSGRLLSGHHLAAHIGTWDIATPNDRESLAGGDWRLIGTIQWQDEFWSTQGPRFDIEVDAGLFGTWRWRGVQTEWLGNDIVVHGFGEPEVIGG